MDLKIRQDEYRKLALSQGFEENYIKKVISNMRVENKIITQKISNKLKHTRGVLFKAMVYESNLKTKFETKLQNHLRHLKFNNVEKVFYTGEHLQVFNMKDANHFNLLEDRQALCDVISYRFSDQMEILYEK